MERFNILYFWETLSSWGSNLMAQKINTKQVDMPFVVTGMYPVFFSQTGQSGTVGNTYAYTQNLPRPIAAGESIMLIPVSHRWATAQLDSNTSTTFSFSLNCTVSTAGMSSKWSAIYYRIN